MFSRNPRWSEEKWRVWRASSTFDRGGMLNDAIDIWRDQILVADLEDRTRKKEEEAQNQGQRHQIRRKAFRARQKQQYGHAALTKLFLKYPLSSFEELLRDRQNYTFSPEYKEQRLRHLRKDDRTEAACQPPASSQTNDVYMDERGIGSSKSSQHMFVASRDAPEAIDWFRKFVADQPPTAPVGDQDALAACSPASIPL